MKLARLQHHVARSGLSLNEIAERAGLTARRLGTLVNREEANPTLDTLVRLTVVLAAALGEDQRTLFYDILGDDLAGLDATAEPSG